MEPVPPSDPIETSGPLETSGPIEASGPIEPWEGRYAEVQQLLRDDPADALALASRWREEDPGSLLAVIALGEALERLDQAAEAARAYGSLIDLYPSRADLRRAAGERLEGVEGGLPLAIDTYRVATLQRPDHPSGHRLLGMALLRARRPAEAFEALASGVEQPYPEGALQPVDRVLREDLALAAAAWTRIQPELAHAIEARLVDLGGVLARAPDVRFVMTWETDVGDVDFHIVDRHGEEASYDHPTLRSGGELYADVTSGYGPECFRIPEPRAWPYTLSARYSRRGPMGYGLGTLQIVTHDGRGRLSFESRPFVVQRDHATVSLGEVTPSGTVPKG